MDIGSFFFWVSSHWETVIVCIVILFEKPDWTILFEKRRDCSIDYVIVYGQNELWVIKKAHGQVSSWICCCVHLFWLNPDVSLTVKHYTFYFSCHNDVSIVDIVPSSRVNKILLPKHLQPNSMTHLILIHLSFFPCL